MTTTQLLLIRHAESLWGTEGRIQGQADPRLSDRGQEQVEALRRRLATVSLAAVYCSPARRAHDTARGIAAPHGLDPQIEQALLEVHLGTWQNRRLSDMSATEIAQYHTWEVDMTSLTPPQGETLDVALARIAPALERILRKHAGETVAVVTHSIIGRMALVNLLGMPLVLASRLRMKKGSISKVRIENGHVVLERFSDSCHLLAHPPSVAE